MLINEINLGLMFLHPPNIKAASSHSRLEMEWPSVTSEWNLGVFCCGVILIPMETVAGSDSAVITVKH